MAITLGTLATFGGCLWILLLIYATLDSLKKRDADLLGGLGISALFAVGILMLLVGVFLLIGRFPGRRGWLVVSALMLTPVAPVVVEALEVQDEVSTANAAAERVYVDRSGLGNVTADCRWSSEGEAFDAWWCDMASTASHERCLFLIRRDAGRITARIFTCKRR